MRLTIFIIAAILVCTAFITYEDVLFPQDAHDFARQWPEPTYFDAQMEQITYLSHRQWLMIDEMNKTLAKILKNYEVYR